MGAPLEPGWVKIIHPDTGNTAEVHRDGLQAYYASGWTLLTADTAPPEPAEAAAPEPMSETQVHSKRARAKAGAEDKTEDAAPAAEE